MVAWQLRSSYVDIIGYAHTNQTYVRILPETECVCKRKFGFILHIGCFGLLPENSFPVYERFF